MYLPITFLGILKKLEKRVPKFYSCIDLQYEAGNIGWIDGI